MVGNVGTSLLHWCSKPVPLQQLSGCGLSRKELQSRSCLPILQDR